MCFYVAGLTQRPKVAGVKRQSLHIKRTPRALLYWAYVVHLGGRRCPTLLLAVLANGVRG